MSVFERVRLLGFGVLAVTFVAGALTGAAIDRGLVHQGRDEVRDERSDDDGDEGRRYIIDRVEMSDDQRTTIDSILERRVDRMQAVWRQVEPHLDAITDSARAEIMDVLTPEQQAEYEAMLERRRESRRGGGDEASRRGGDPGSRGEDEGSPSEEPGGTSGG